MGTRPISDYLRRNFRGVYPSSAPPPLPAMRVTKFVKRVGNSESRVFLAVRRNSRTRRALNPRIRPTNENRKRNPFEGGADANPKDRSTPPNVPQKWSDRAPGISIRERENDCGGGPRRLPHLEFHLTWGAFWRLAAHLRSALGWDA